MPGIETVLRLCGEERTRERARLSHFLGALATTQGDYRAAEHSLQRSLSLYEELGDESGIAASLNALAVAARDRGDYASAQANFERSLACWRLLSDRLAIARCLHNLANVVKVRGDYPRARWALGEATDIFEELGDRSGAAWSINQQGDIARETGDLVTAREFYRRALSAFREDRRPVGLRAVVDRSGLHRLRAGKSPGRTHGIPRSHGTFRRIGASARDGAGAGRVCVSGSGGRTRRTGADPGGRRGAVTQADQRSAASGGTVQIRSMR